MERARYDNHPEYWMTKAQELHLWLVQDSRDGTFLSASAEGFGMPPGTYCMALYRTEASCQTAISKMPKKPGEEARFKPLSTNLLLVLSIILRDEKGVVQFATIEGLDGGIGPVFPLTRQGYENIHKASSSEEPLDPSFTAMDLKIRVAAQLITYMGCEVPESGVAWPIALQAILDEPLLPRSLKALASVSRYIEDDPGFFTDWSNDFRSKLENLSMEVAMYPDDSSAFFGGRMPSGECCIFTTTWDKQPKNWPRRNHSRKTVPLMALLDEVSSMAASGLLDVFFLDEEAYPLTLMGNAYLNKKLKALRRRQARPFKGTTDTEIWLEATRRIAILLTGWTIPLDKWRRLLGAHRADKIPLSAWGSGKSRYSARS